MFRKAMVMLLLAIPVLLPRAAGAAESESVAAALIPEDAILVVQVHRPKALIERAFDDRVVKFVKELPPYKEAMAKDETQQVLQVVKFFENKYGMDLKALLGKLLGGGITLAISPGEQNLLIVESEDPKMLNEIHDFFKTIARGEARKQGNPDRVASQEYRGVTGWTFSPGEVHAIVGNRLLLSNKPETLKAALDRQAEAQGKSLTDSNKYASARKSVSEDAEITLFADMSVLKQLPGFQKALSENENPMGRLLFAPIMEALSDASWLSAGLSLEQSDLKIEIITDGGAGAPTSLNRFAMPQTPNGAMPNLVVPRQIAAFSFYRDLHKFYASKDELFPERTSGLIFFENMMGIFFSGKDLTQEVLAQTTPDLRVVVAEQKYDEKTGTPALQLPGFAVVVRLRDPDKFSLVMKEAWQKAIGLVNFTRGQQALPGLIIDSATHGGTIYTTSFFSIADEENKSAVDIRFNFQPSLAIQGDYMVMSSSDALARDLIDALQQESARGTKPVAGTHSMAVVKSAPLASILNANRDAMIRQNMVEDGKTRAEAQQEVDGIQSVLNYLTGIQMDAGVANGQSRLTIKLGYQLP